MRIQIVFPSVVAASLLFLGVLQSQTVPTLPPAPPPGNQPGLPSFPPSGYQNPFRSPPSAEGKMAGSGQEYPAPAPEITPEPPGRLSDFILGRRSTDCFCPVGDNGPIKTELYLDNGMSFPFGRTVFGRILETGWDIQGGARTLFFNPSLDRAWFIDTGIGNIHNAAGSRTFDNPIPLTRIVPDVNGTPMRVNFGQGAIPGVTIHSVNRTYVNLGLGRYWYLSPVDCDSWHWRIGLDSGFRYGSENLRFNELPHRSHVMYGAYVAGRSDLEIPCGCCTWIAGLRLEYAYTWSTSLQEISGDLREINLLFTLGVRY